MLYAPHTNGVRGSNRGQILARRSVNKPFPAAARVREGARLRARCQITLCSANRHQCPRHNHMYMVEIAMLRTTRPDAAEGPWRVFAVNAKALFVLFTVIYGFRT